MVMGLAVHALSSIVCVVIGADQPVAFAFRERGFATESNDWNLAARMLGEPVPLHHADRCNSESFGIAWGVSGKEFAVAFVNAKDAGTKATWIRSATRHSPFPLFATIAGRSRDFTWYGVANGMVMVDSNPPAETIVADGLRRAEETMLLTTDPLLGLSRLLTCRDGEFNPDSVQSVNNDLVIQHVHNKEWEIRLSLHYRNPERAGLPETWGLFMRSLHHPRTIIRTCTVEAFEPQWLPSNAAEIVHSYANTTSLPAANIQPVLPEIRDPNPPGDEHAAMDIVAAERSSSKSDLLAAWLFAFGCATFVFSRILARRTQSLSKGVT